MSRFCFDSQIYPSHPNPRGLSFPRFGICATFFFTGGLDLSSGVRPRSFQRSKIYGYRCILGHASSLLLQFRLLVSRLAVYRAPHQCVGAQGGNIGPPSLDYNITGPSCFDRYRQYHCCSLHQQARWDPFPPPVAASSGSVSVATDSGNNSVSQTHSRLSKCDSRPVVSAEPAHHNRVESPPRSRESDIQTVGNSSSGLVYHSPQHASRHFMSSVSEPRALAIDALLQDWQGRLMYMFPPFALLNKVIQKLRTTQTGEVILIAPWWPSHNRGFHTATTECGPPTILSIPQILVVTTGLYLERQVIPSARMEALMQHYQAAGFSKEVSRLATAPRRPSTKRMYDDRWLRFANWATGKGFDPLGPTAAQIAAFLYEFFDTRGLSPQTIKGYRSC